jgi:hypothetical protein
MSTRQALALPSPAPSNTVVINARCSFAKRSGSAGLPVHHYRAEDAVAEAYAMVFLVESGFARQTGAWSGHLAQRQRRSQAAWARGVAQAL